MKKFKNTSVKYLYTYEMNYKNNNGETETMCGYFAMPNEMSNDEIIFTIASYFSGLWDIKREEIHLTKIQNVGLVDCIR